MESILTYIKHPSCIIGDIKYWWYKMRMATLNRYRKRIYNYEFNEVLNNKISDPYGIVVVSNTNVGIFSPILVVTKTIENYFGFHGYMRLNIHGIDVDTQCEVVKVTFRIHRPGLLIGRGGRDIDAIKEQLQIAFNRQVAININEVRTDKNEPTRFDF